MPGYAGGGLYPSRKKHSKAYALTPDFSFTVSVNENLLREKWEEGAGDGAPVEYALDENAVLSLLVTVPAEWYVYYTFEAF
jgi:hypothetical protein